jgi:Predicted pyridoxal phosphate-dependent enzyme apparently involved in regulation of cell wall biogenesis
MVPINEPLLIGREKEYLVQCIESGWISSAGPFVSEFERRLSEKVGRKFGIAVSNGSVALETAVSALGIGPGDSVIIPAFTIISCAAAIVRSGAIPVLCDADPSTWNIDLNQLEDIIKKEVRRTDVTLKAILVVHIYGLPVDMKIVNELAEKYGLAIIEDSAEMIGQTSRGQPCGSFGKLSTFSFYANKIITAGEGGMVVTDDNALSEKCRKIRNLYFDEDRQFIHEELGWNFRMSNLQAAVGLAQLERLGQSIALKKKIGKRYTELLQDCPRLQLPVEKMEYAENIYWVYGLVLSDDIPFDASEAIRRLQQLKIGARHFFWPMHLQPCLKKRGLFDNEKYPVSERLAQKGFYLPSGMALTNSQITEAADAVKEILS